MTNAAENKVSIVAFDQVLDMTSVANDLRIGLADPANADIAIDFPGTAARYSGRLEAVRYQLLLTAEQCAPGKREQFIVFAGRSAVGVSAIQLTEHVPDGVAPTTPNVSSFILNPWRAQGLGYRSLAHRLMIADTRFGGYAYSLVRKENVASQRLVEKAGLVNCGANDTQYVYSYSK